MAAKFALVDFSPFLLAFLRFTLAASVLWIVGEYYRKGRPIDRADQRRLWGLGLLAVPLNQGLFLTGLQWTTTAHSALLYSLTPLFVMVIAARQLGERITAARLVGILVAFAGVVMVLLHSGLHMAPGQLRGDLITLCAVIAWAMFTVLCKPLVIKYGAAVVTARAMCYGTVLFVPLGIGSLGGFHPTQVSSSAWLGLLYIALVTSVVFYTIWNWAMRFVDAARVAVFNNIQPVVAAILGWVFLGEAITTTFLVAGCVVVVGVLITELA